MTCEQARNLLKGAWAVSAAIAFTRHWDKCPACQEFVQGIVANIPIEERRAQADEFDRTLSPLMAEALANDPEV